MGWKGFFMEHPMNQIARAIPRLFFIITLTATPILAGSLTPPGEPEEGSGMPTTTEIYNRLDTGAAISAPGTFKEPAAGPTTGTGKSLKDIQNKLPEPDNTNGATAAQVMSGKTFWGINKDAGAWGLQTGSNTAVVDTTIVSRPATAAEICYGQQAYVNGILVTGTMTGCSCVIGGSTYANGTVNPTNSCSVCDSSLSSVAWSLKSNGSACNDGDANTTGDVCTSGVCAGVDLCAGVTCSALDQCHVVGTCDHATGVCSNPPVTCSALDQCHDAGTCDHVTGVCSNPPKADGTSCSAGNPALDRCISGVCINFW